MISKTRSNCFECRRGVTIIDVIVSSFCVICLLALIIPGCTHANSKERLVKCQDNIRRLARAAIGYSETNDARPAQGYYGTSMETGMPTVFESRSWVVELLPFMDQAAMKQQWSNKRPWDSAETDPRERSNRKISEMHLPKLICPSDTTAAAASPSLSYVINAGIGDTKYTAFPDTGGAKYDDIGHSPVIEPFDWNRNGTTPPSDEVDIKQTADYCLTWPILEDSVDSRLAAVVPKFWNLTNIFDGAGLTILFAENIHAGTVKDRSVNSWANPQVANCAFIVPISPEKAGRPTPRTNGTMLLELVDLSAEDPYMNQSRQGAEGQTPFPNSSHPGLVFVAFCDGSVGGVSDNIHNSIYLRLVTPNGVRMRLSGSLEMPLSDSGEIPLIEFESPEYP